MAEGIQMLAYLIADIALAANTDLKAPEIWMAYGYVGTQITSTMAIGTVGIAQAVRRDGQLPIPT